MTREEIENPLKYEKKKIVLFFIERLKNKK